VKIVQSRKKKRRGKNKKARYHSSKTEIYSAWPHCRFAERALPPKGDSRQSPSSLEFAIFPCEGPEA